MTNLLQIEQAFLSQPMVKNALKLTEIKTMQRSLSNAQKKKFEQSLTMSKLVLDALTWWKSDEGKAKFAEEGIEWSTEEFGLKVFGWQKSFFYKMTRVAKVEEAVVETFKTQCDEMERNGVSPDRSVSGLLKFAKQSEETATEGGEGEGEGEAQAESRTQTVFTMTFKTESGNVAVRIDSEGKVKTTNSGDEIAQAIAFLTQTLNNHIANG